MNPTKTFALILSITPCVGTAQIFSRPLEEYVREAQVIAHVEVVASTPELPFPETQFYCGHAVTARVLEAFKGPIEGETVRFGNSDPMKVGTQYLVALDSSTSFEKDTVTTIVPLGATSEEAKDLKLACLKRLPPLHAEWLFTSEFVGPVWVTWGFRVKATPKEDGLAFIGRKKPHLIEKFKYVRGREKIEAIDDSKENPLYAPIFATKFDYPTLYVEWFGYQQLLLRMMSGK